MRIKRLSFFFYMLLLPGTICSYSLPNHEATAKFFAQGNSEYQNGNYKLAEQYYVQILDSGVDSGPVYFNLGNACFKQKRIGEAIYYWEKARQKLPADPEIQQNLELANLMCVDRIEIPPDPLPFQILAKAQGFFTIAQETWILFILFIAANVFFSIYLLMKNPPFAYIALIGSLGAGLLFMVFGCSLIWKVYDNEHRKKGVVIEQKVDVRSGPGPENITVFTIHEGIKVRVHESSNGWYQISLPNGWSGWLQKSYLRIL